MDQSPQPAIDPSLPSGWSRPIPTPDQSANFGSTYTAEQVVDTILRSPSLTLLFVDPGYIHHLPMLQRIQRWWRKLRAAGQDPTQ